MSGLSDTVKVSLYARDITEDGASHLHRRDAITVRNYGYTMTRDVDSGSVADGRGTIEVFTVIIRVGVKDDIKKFYECMTHPYMHTFSLIFNARFDGQALLADYDGALLMEGYIIAIEELYERARAVEGHQMSLEMKIKVRQVTYIGQNNNLVYSF